MSQHDAAKNTTETTPIETLLDESSGSQELPRDTSEARSEAPTEAPSYAAPHAAPGTQAALPQSAVPDFKSGPAPTTSVIGLLGLLTAIAVLVSQATDLDIPWGVVGPVAVVGAGVLLVVLGLAGLRGQRFRG